MSVAKKNKNLAIKLFPLVLVLTILAGFLFAKGEVGENTDRTGRIEISGVWVKDFLKEAGNRKTYVTLVKNENYHIFFIPKQELFVISITASPFEDQRLKAEEEFLKQLGIDKRQACKLEVNITTPSFANPNEAGRIYKMSFCNK